MLPISLLLKNEIESAAVTVIAPPLPEPVVSLLINVFSSEAELKLRAIAPASPLPLVSLLILLSLIEAELTSMLICPASPSLLLLLLIEVFSI
ncbi:MAG TPA: hypothetical protein V6D48_04690 [Oculatellaceae cyanobacterium]